MRNKLFKFILNSLIATSMIVPMSISAEDLDVEIIDSYSGSVQYVGVSGDIGTPNEQWEAELNSYAPHPIAWRLTVYTLNDMDTLETLKTKASLLLIN